MTEEMLDNNTISEVADKSCSCGALEQISDEWPLPFNRPTVIDRETKDIKSGDWSVKCQKLTALGNVSKSGAQWIVMNYCPFCGGQLREGLDSE